MDIQFINQLLPITTEWDVPEESSAVLTLTLCRWTDRPNHTWSHNIRYARNWAIGRRRLPI
jgi:hypothetical protein